LANPKTIMGSPRVRASERAVKVAIKAMQNSGLQVSKLVVVGATIEVHAVVPAEITSTATEPPGLKDW
jgi:hypothetical protein